MKPFAPLIAVLLLLTATWTWATPPGPGKPFDCTLGGTTSCATDDAGCVPDTKDNKNIGTSTLKCADAIAKAFGKTVAAVWKCHAKAADAAFKGAPIDDEACETGPNAGKSAKEKLDAAIAKVTPFCTAVELLAAADEEATLFADETNPASLDAQAGSVYCDGTTAIDSGTDDAGTVDSLAVDAKSKLKCADTVGKELGKLLVAAIKCHVKMADSFFAGEEFDEAVCEENDPVKGKAVLQKYTAAMAKIDPICTQACLSSANRNTLGANTLAQFETANAKFYPCLATTTTTTSTTTTSTLPCPFVTKWGDSGSEDGNFNGPEAVAVDGTGNVFVADGGNDRIQVFSNTGTFLAKWGSSGGGDGEFSIPIGIAVDGSGNVFVADRFNHRIQKFTDTGTFLTKWGSDGPGDGQFSAKFGIAVDGSGNVLVADDGNDRIQVFSNTGTFLTKWGSSGGGDGQFNGPVGVAVDGSGTVFVVDQFNYRIQKFDNTGTFLTKWGGNGIGDGQFSYPGPVGIAVHGSGKVFVAASGDDQIQEFTNTGTFITKWGTFGSGVGQFRGPGRLTFDASGNLFVADTNNDRIQKFACP